MGGATEREPRGLLAICYLGFVSLGLPDTVIGVVWPSVRGSFGVGQSAVSWIFFGAGASYFLSSFFAGRLVQRFNVGLLLAGSSGLVAVSGFNYGLATVWGWFAVGALLHGLGSGAIDSGLNHYVASHFSARHMNWLHASYTLGATLGPIIATACLTRAGSWRMAYLVVAGILTALALLFVATKGWWGASSGEPEAAAGGGSAWGVLRNRVVQLHVLLFFLYTGLEVAVGQWSFTILTESRGVKEAAAGSWVTIYWASLFAGRVLFGFVVDRVSIDGLIRWSLVGATAGAGLFVFAGGTALAAVALGLCGFGLAVIFPCLMTRTPQRLGADLAAHAIGLQVGAAMLGAAVLPSVCGLVAEKVGLFAVAWVLAGVALAVLVAHEILIARGRSLR